MIKDKGVFDAIECFRTLISRGWDLNLKLAGESYKNNPSSLTVDEIDKLKGEFGSRIEFLGFVSDISKCYQKSNILILPSKREGFPVCVMEASASGLPSISYDVPGCRDAISSGVNGKLVEYGNTLALADTIEELFCLETLSSYRKSCI
ncbi:glycosyltransferase, partial [Vibrio campbellii]|uniref:glycosyltransferase n=1 Tax=Vibrio campbellii TaxID=680 RepID=UPI001E37D315